MPDRATWEKRVAAWRASGLTSRRYAKGRPFSASGLRYWACRLRREEPVRVAATPQAIRLGRVLRRLAPAPEAAAPEPARELPAPVPAPGVTLTVECGSLRVAVPVGFDRATLAAVLDVLVVREGRR